MATEITLEALTNGSVNATSGDWEGAGIFDKLIAATNANIEVQYTKGRITTTDFATVYLGSIQAVLQQSMQYALSERKLEVDIDNAVTQGNLLEAQLAEVMAATARAETQLADSLLTSAKQRILLDEEKDTADLNQIILAKEASVKELQSDKLIKDIEIAERDMSEKELTGIKQRTLLDEEKDLLQTQDSEMISNGLKDRELKSAQLNKINSDTALTEQQIERLSAETTLVAQKVVGRKQ